jgi:hypothetical protein
VNRLREQIQKEGDPVAIGKAVAAIYLDQIARIRAFEDQLDLAIGYKLFAPDVTFPENYARAWSILRISAKLDSMLLKQIVCFLKCFGGTEAIAIQKIVTWARGDPTRGHWLMAFADAMRSRRRS